MAIKQIEKPCWIPSWPGDDRSDGDLDMTQGPHYTSAERVPTYKGSKAAFHKDCGGTLIFGLDGYCTRCEAEGLGDDDWEELPVVPRQLAAPCFAATCDGCDYAYDEDGEGREHFTSEAEALESIRAANWTVEDNGIQCSECNGENERELQRALASVRPAGEH